MMGHISLPHESVAAGSGSSSSRQDSKSLGGGSAPTGEISGSLEGKDMGESPIEGSGGGARGELSSTNCGIALWGSMPAPLTLLKLQYPPVRQFQGALISVGAMWVAAGVDHKTGGELHVSGVPELWIELSSLFEVAGFGSPIGSTGILWDPSAKRSRPPHTFNLAGCNVWKVAASDWYGTSGVRGVRPKIYVAPLHDRTHEKGVKEISSFNIYIVSVNGAV
jgi:hypothetical protein